MSQLHMAGLAAEPAASPAAKEAEAKAAPEAVTAPSIDQDMPSLLFDTRPAEVYWPEDLDQLGDQEAAKLAIAFVKMSKGLLVLIRVVGGMPSRN